MTYSEKSHDLIRNFAYDIVELVRESLIEEAENILVAKFEPRQLPAAKSHKRLATGSRPKALKSRVKIQAVPTEPQLTPSVDFQEYLEHS